MSNVALQKEKLLELQQWLDGEIHDTECGGVFRVPIPGAEEPHTHIIIGYFEFAKKFKAYYFADGKHHMEAFDTAPEVALWVNLVLK